MNDLLETSVIGYPSLATGFAEKLLGMLEARGERQNDQLKRPCTVKHFIPEIMLDFQTDDISAHANFIYANGEEIRVGVDNITGLHRANPRAYRPLDIETVTQWLSVSGIHLLGIDHVGINLPWINRAFTQH